MTFIQPMKLSQQNNRQKLLNFNPYVVNVWNCHFKKIIELQANSIFQMDVK